MQSLKEASRQRHAILVRHSEMHILKKLIEEITEILPKGTTHEFSLTSEANSKQRPKSKKELREEKKRAREEEDLYHGSGSKKSRR